MESQRVCSRCVRSSNVSAHMAHCTDISTPFMLDSYAAEWQEQCKAQTRHADEVDNLRNANRNLSSTMYVTYPDRADL